MKLPIIVISYGEFSSSKKILSYEDQGECLIPIFYDLEHAEAFADGMRDRMRELKDPRELSVQVCSEARHAISFFTAIGMLAGPTQKVIVNPPKPGVSVSKDTSAFLLSIEEKLAISEVLEKLNQEFSTDGSTETGEPKKL